MDELLSAKVKELVDREAIRGCLMRYTRGVDRLDREMLLSAYHPDALDDHGVFVGDREAFVEWVFDHHLTYQIGTQHIIVNTVIDLDGDAAHVESYFIFLGRNRTGPNTLAFGRYIDAFAKREGRWAISARICLVESNNDMTEAFMADELRAVIQTHGSGERDRSDLSYARPLKITRAITHGSALVT